MSHDSHCAFCKIVAAQIPASVVFENQTSLAFLDIGPLADGHLLLIPRDHYPALVDMPREESTRLLSVIPVLGRALLEVTGAEGFNVLINNGTAAGQVVPHAHIHLIPRQSGDKLGYRWHVSSYENDRPAELALAYQEALRKHID